MSKKKGKIPATGDIVCSIDPDRTLRTESLEINTLSVTQQRLRIEYSRTGHAGKEAFIIRDFADSDSDLADLTRQLKQPLSYDDFTRDSEVLIQQNNKEKLIKLLQSEGYEDTK